jgi:hypothetical protein
MGGSNTLVCLIANAANRIDAILGGVLKSFHAVAENVQLKNFQLPDEFTNAIEETISITQTTQQARNAQDTIKKQSETAVWHLCHIILMFCYIFISRSYIFDATLFFLYLMLGKRRDGQLQHCNGHSRRTGFIHKP